MRAAYVSARSTAAWSVGFNQSIPATADSTDSVSSMTASSR